MRVPERVTVLSNSTGVAVVAAVAAAAVAVAAAAVAAAAVAAVAASVAAVAEWLYYSKRIIIVRWADLSDYFSFIFVGKMWVLFHVQ